MGKHHVVAQVLPEALALASTNGYTYPCAALTAKQYLLQVKQGPLKRIYDRHSTKATGFSWFLHCRTTLRQHDQVYAKIAATGELSPPYSGSPQVTTDPLARIAANACSVA